jgi:hypothetical protein
VKAGYDAHAAQEIIEDKIGRQLECECQILNDENAIRRHQLRSCFGVDFGELGRKELGIY